MEWTFLGTSSGVPTRQRNVSALALRSPEGKHWYLVDCGEGTQHQLLDTGYSLHHLAAIFITHVHGDHCLGLPGLLSTAAMDRRNAPLTIVAPRSLRRFIDAALEVTESSLPFPWEFVPVEDMAFWRDAHFSVKPSTLSHRVPSYAYAFTERQVDRKLNIDKLRARGIQPGPVWRTLLDGEAVQLASGKRLKPEDYLLPPRKPRRLIVAGDNDTPELLSQACQGADVLVHESTYTWPVFERVGAGRQHSYAAAVARFAENVNLPNLILTHFSPRYQHGTAPGGLTLSDVETEARRFYHGQLFLAEDFARYRLDKSGTVIRTDSGQVRDIPPEENIR